MRLQDKVAIVTGAGSGIGKSIATVFGSEGAMLIAASRTLSSLEETVEQIESKGGKAKAIPTDISDEHQVSHLVERVLQDYGRIDVLVNNAAAMSPRDIPVAEMDLDYWSNQINVNLTGTMLITKHVVKSMTDRQSGSIVNVSSIAGVTGNPWRSPYASSKAGIIGFTETLAMEVGPYNIRVNALTPAATATERFEANIRAKAQQKGVTYEALMEKVLRHYSLRRIATPSEVAMAALFLASDESSGITGQNLIISCGFHMLHPAEILD